MVNEVGRACLGAVVRAARVDEVAELSRLAVRTLLPICPTDLPQADIQSFIDDHLTPERFAGYLVNAEAEVIVAELDGRARGYALLLFGDAARPPSSSGVTVYPVALLSKCYVDEEFHGAGVGKLLLDAALDVARRRRTRAVWLNTNHRNHRAQRFYAKHGWRQTGWLDFVVGQMVYHDPVFMCDC
ncbi:GNAT family N-acetyltransferase [Tessaracoccus sp. OH4464_COT-324]|uniref:GNAT family N-acetyltransferase n=1 Tax=Tessaracoccus sp. OH4464_COT-324 TaxID=2491059 RepID=UPI000F63563B|nr:GNAT family N-acetyltransferase [Tessaracoccus sp. OH4464_COT-324]RRD46499.1 GNAT family N-acetyltransferase [Tessaracoccus sp. OH4464_COT-324]